MSNDLISRDALVEKLLLLKKAEPMQRGISTAIAAVLDQPYVAAIPQRGEWKNGCECSICDMAYGPRNENQKQHYRFCPNCGARMEEESDENADEIKPYRKISVLVTNVDNVDLIKERSYRLTADISDYLEQLATLKWIGVEDALPQAGRICAVYGRGRDNRPRYDLAIMDKARTWEFGAMSAFEITHWIALPQPQKEEKK